MLLARCRPELAAYGSVEHEESLLFDLQKTATCDNRLQHRRVPMYQSGCPFRFIIIETWRFWARLAGKPDSRSVDSIGAKQPFYAHLRTKESITAEMPSNLVWLNCDTMETLQQNGQCSWSIPGAVLDINIGT